LRIAAPGFGVPKTKKKNENEYSRWLFFHKQKTQKGGELPL
jgi:hypothetical protein